MTCICACMFDWVYVYAHTRVHIRTVIHPCAGMCRPHMTYWHIYTYLCIHKYMCICIHIYIYIHAYVYICIYVYVYMYMRAWCIVDIPEKVTLLYIEFLACEYLIDRVRDILMTCWMSSRDLDKWLSYISSSWYSSSWYFEFVTFWWCVEWSRDIYSTSWST